MEPAEFEIADTVQAAIRAGSSPVQAFREWRGYGVTALAMASGVPASAIAEHEAGRYRLTLDECDAIGGALGIPCELLQEYGMNSADHFD